MTARPRTLVVAGLVLRGTEMLVSRRRADQSLPLLWELPGGKVEPGEAPVAALRRELQEELGIVVEVGRIWEVLFHPYPAFDLVMLVYACQIVTGEPRAVEVAEVAWTALADLWALDLVPADRPLVERLTKEGPPA